jgi:outer membrane protein OmpA-like peptidoglycan-associated protein
MGGSPVRRAAGEGPPIAHGSRLAGVPIVVRRTAATDRWGHARQLTRRARAAQGERVLDAYVRSGALEAQLRYLNAKKTERGLVVNIGDVLFETDKAQVSSGGLQGVNVLASLRNRLPQRQALFEGFTESAAGESHNQALSGRRAVLSSDGGSITPR